MRDNSNGYMKQFEYKCLCCSNVFVSNRRMHESYIRKCTVCGSRDVWRINSSSFNVGIEGKNLIFKR